MGCSVSLLHAWHFQAKWKNHWNTKKIFQSSHCKTSDGILPKLLHYLMFANKNCLVDISSSVEDKNVPQNCTRCTWASPKHQKQLRIHKQKEKCKIYEDNCESKSEKDNIPMSKEQCQSCSKSIFRAHSMRIFNSCLQWHYLLI